MPKIVLIRGNSGSGKSTVANALQKKLGSGTLLISQDYVRREMLRVKDRPNNPAIDLLINLITYGYHNCEFTILEGILYTDIYESLFRQIETLFKENIFAYYFDVSFEETLKRHFQKPISHEYGEAEMRRWWRDNDLLSRITERKINKTMSIDESVNQIYLSLMNL